MGDDGLEEGDYLKGSVWSEVEGIRWDRKTVHLLHHLLGHNGSNERRGDLHVKEEGRENKRNLVLSVIHMPESTLRGEKTRETPLFRIV